MSGVRSKVGKGSKQGKPCFVNPHCSYDCPNFEVDACDERYGYGIAEDMGLERISCKECRYGALYECEDCYLFGSKHCPEAVSCKD